MSIAKTACKKIGAWIHSMKFLSPEVALYLYKSTIDPCMEYCFTSELLSLVRQATKINMQDCWSFMCYFSWTLGSSLKCGQLRSFLYVDVLHKWLNWFHFLFLEGGLLVILIDCMIFLSPFLDVRRMSISTVSFLTQLDSGILCQ